MRRRFFLLIILMYSCSEKTVLLSDLAYLNGYWEIKEVTFSDGLKKEYRTGPAVDFVHFEEMQGFRKKVYPRLNGSFDTSNNSESFVMVETEDGFVFNYRTDSSNWQEKLLEIDSISFTVLNEDGLTYSYRRFEPINIAQ